MAAVTSVPAFTAFESQLKTLCLNEFPCGLGRWRENHKKKKSSLTAKDRLNTTYSITLKDFGAEHEKTETLEELVTAKSSPWNLDYSWSNEAKELREIAVKSPWLIDEGFVLKHFKTLRIVDKGVSEVDENLLKFTELEELTLSANYLCTVNSRNFPPKLKVLELTANQISNLADLCISAPPLIHLGLGYNRLVMVDDYITGEYWPSLLSLDLSHNDLCDLMDIVRKLQSLPKLRNLVLQGNPLALIPGYRGYTIDSLRKLSCLDDISISADEKHHYKGLARRREYILDEAKLTLGVTFMKGLPMPEEMKNPEEQPEFPIVTRKFFVQFMFLEDKSGDAEVFHILHDDHLSASQMDQNDQLDTDRRSLLAGSDVQQLNKSLEVSSTTEKNVNFAQELETAQSPTTYNSNENPEGQSVVSDSFALGESAQPPVDGPCPQPNDGPVPIKLAPINTEKVLWQDDQIELNWTETVIRDDLLALRNFIKQNMEIQVVEEKVLSYPADQMQEGQMNVPESGKKKDKGKEDKAKDVKKDTKPPVDPKKKKKGEPDIELAHMPPEYTTIATFQVPLEDFLEGEFEFENVYIKNMEVEEGGTHTPASEVDKKEKKEKKKPGSGKKKDEKEKSKDGKKSPKVDKKESKGGKDDKAKGKGGATQGEAEDEPPPPPPPLEVQVSVRLHHWKTAQDSLKDEEERDIPRD